VLGSGSLVMARVLGFSMINADDWAAVSNAHPDGCVPTVTDTDVFATDINTSATSPVTD
jgi:hypothetical protein